MAQVLNQSVCTTMALHTYIYLTVDKCRHPQESVHFECMYNGLIKCGLEAMRTYPRSEDRVIMIGAHALDVDHQGQVSGFRQCLETLHSSVSAMMVSHWTGLHNDGSIASSLMRETLSLCDVAYFLLTYGRQTSWGGPPHPEMPY